MGELTHYTREQKLEAATHYAVYGSLAKLERDLGIPKSTSCTWKKNDDVWVEQIEQVRTEKRDEHIASYHELTRKSLAKANEGIDNLDVTKLTASDIKALVITGAASTDKSLLLDGRPTSISSSGAGTQVLAEQLRQLSRSLQEKQAKVVATQLKADNGEEE